jgi:hypothetical protein
MAPLLDGIHPQPDLSPADMNAQIKQTKAAGALDTAGSTKEH